MFTPHQMSSLAATTNDRTVSFGSDPAWKDVVICSAYRVVSSHMAGPCDGRLSPLADRRRISVERQVSRIADVHPECEVRVRTCRCETAAIGWLPSVTEVACGISDRLLLGDTGRADFAVNSR